MHSGDLTAQICTGHRLSAAVSGGLVISATGVRPGSRRLQPMECGASPTALCGRSAEAAGDDLPVIAEQAGGWQMPHDAAHRRFHPGAELHEVFAQDAELGGSEGRPRGSQTKVRNPATGR